MGIKRRIYLKNTSKSNNSSLALLTGRAYNRAQYDGDRLKILLLEPDRILAGIYKSSLEEQGHTVVPVSSAQAAVMAADTAKPDVIILEIQLIEHSGIEFLYELRSYPEWQDIPVVIQTGVPPAEFNDNQQLLREQLGVVGYLYKPQSTLGHLHRQLKQLAPQTA